MIRLFSIATVSTGMLLARANLAMPAVSTVWAAEPDNQTTQSSHTDTTKIPESNPYADNTQCTAGAWDLAAQAGHKLPWFAGDAKDWKQGAIDDGYNVADKLDGSVVNSVAVWDAGVGGTGDAGHVAWVVEVKGDQFRVKERNWSPAADGERWVTWESGISFIKFDKPESQPKPADAARAAPTNGQTATAASPSDSKPTAAQPASSAAPVQASTSNAVAPASTASTTAPAHPAPAAQTSGPQPIGPFAPFVVVPWAPVGLAARVDPSAVAALAKADPFSTSFAAGLGNPLTALSLSF